MHSKALRRGICAAVLAVSLPVCATAAFERNQGGQTTPPAKPGQQTSTEPAKQQAKPEQQPEGQKPTFKVRVDLVTTDVIVKDSKGQFVPDIDKKEFEIFEDGVKQDIVSMDVVHGGRVNNILSATAPAAEEGIILPTSRPVNDAAGRIFIFFIDDLHLQFQNTTRVRELLRKMNKQLLHDGDMFAVQTTGPSSIAQDLTYDRRLFDKLIDKVAGSELKPTEIINGPDGAEGPSEVRYRAHVAFSTVNDLLTTLEQVHNRRKALIYVSDGYDFNPFETARTGEDPNGIFAGRIGQDRSQYDPNVNMGKQFADADLVRELAEVTRTANRANVTMYTFDPRGLVGPMGDLDEQVDPTEWQDFIHKSQDSLRTLADLTGGIAAINVNDYTKVLDRIDQETSDYYVLGFYSKNPDPTKRDRTIEVKVTRKGTYNIWSRKGYSLKRLPK